MRLTLLGLSVAALVAGCASTPPEADPVQLKLNDLDARLTRIERIVANQVEVAQRLDEVQSAVRQLRGRLEELEHGNEALARQQRDLYAWTSAWRQRAGRRAARRPAAPPERLPRRAAPRPRAKRPGQLQATRRPRSSRRCIPRRLTL